MLLLWLTLKSTDTELRKYVLLSQQSAVRYWVRSREGLLRNCVKNSWKQNQYWTKWSVSSLVLPLDGSGRRQRAVKNIFLNVIWSFSNIENDKRTEDRIFQGVCQPISKIVGDPLPVWGNPNLIINQCSWCISSRVDANYNYSAQRNFPLAWATDYGHPMKAQI